eukprot:3803140-Rhodomonas_salina.2
MTVKFSHCPSHVAGGRRSPSGPGPPGGSIPRTPRVGGPGHWHEEAQLQGARVRRQARRSFNLNLNSPRHVPACRLSSRNPAPRNS